MDQGLQTGKPFVLLVSIAWFRSNNCFSKESPIRVLNCYMFWGKALEIFVLWLFHVRTVKDWELEMWHRPLPVSHPRHTHPP